MIYLDSWCFYASLWQWITGSCNSTSSHLVPHVCLMESTLDIWVSQLVFMTLSCQSWLMGGVAKEFQAKWQWQPASEKLIRLSSICWELFWQWRQNIWRCLEQKPLHLHCNSEEEWEMETQSFCLRSAGGGHYSSFQEGITLSDWEKKCKRHS